MFKNREYVSQVVGSAALGVAVGMLVHKILSPRSSQQPSNIAASPIRYEYVQEQSKSNSLLIPSHCNKHRNYRHHSRSKSASKAEQVEAEIGYLSVSSPLMKKSKLRASETDLGSYLRSDNDKSTWCHYEKLEPKKKSVNTASDSEKISADTDSFIFNTSTKFTPSNSEDSKICTFEKNHKLNCFGKSSVSKSTENIPSQLEDREDLCDTTKDYKLNSYHENFGSNSTEYFVLNLINQKNLDDTTKDCKLNSYCGTFPSESDKYLPLNLEDQKDLRSKAKDYKFDYYRESCASKSTDYVSLKLKDENNREVNSYLETLTEPECRKNLSIKREKKFNFYEPLSLLFDVNNRKSMTNNHDFIFSSSNLESKGMLNYTTMATCDTVEKDFNFDLSCQSYDRIKKI